MASVSEDQDAISPQSYKLVLLGDSSVGKTSLVHRFVTNTFNQHTTNTIGAAFITKECISSLNPIKRLKFEIWDTAGQERYRSLTPMYYRNAKVALVVYDLSNPDDSFEKAKSWIDQLRLNMGDQSGQENIKIILLGNKADLINSNGSERVETLDRIDQYTRDENITSLYTSAKTGENVQEVFSSIVDDLEASFYEEYNEEQKKKAGDAGKQTQLNLLASSIRSNNSSSCC